MSAGEILCLLGPNGAGKSTLLRILSTTVLADSGTAELMGTDVARDPTRAKRQMGLHTPDERAWYWPLTGRQNLVFFAALRGLYGPAGRAAVDGALATSDMTDHADRRVGTYSSGMRVRLAAARAFLGSPPILLLDEPTRSLDPVAAAAFREIVLKAAGDGAAVLFVTHDLHEAASIASRVALMIGGRIERSLPAGTPPATLEAALLGASTNA